MSRRIRLLLALGALALAATPAAAQPAPAPARPSHTIVIPYRVDGFTPTSGRPGVRVTVTGNGFTRSTTVLVGGRQARVASFRSTELVFVVPRVTGAAEVVLRKPGGIGDLRVGSFHVLVDPVISRVTPGSGGPGARVEVTGSGFQRGDTIAMGGRTLPVVEVSPDRIVVTIPAGVSSDYLTLSRPSGESARSRQRFRVRAEAPVIASFSPEIGPPGARVRISGTGFSAADRVQYGSRRIEVLGRGNGWVDVELPRRAQRGEHFLVRGPGGDGKSPRPFTLDVPPILSSFAPRRGAPGSKLEVYGRNFREGDWVSLAGKRLPITRLAERQVSAVIPQGSRSGPVTVGRDGYQTAAAGRFDVFNPPMLTAFTPARGEPGSRVTLTGAYLSGAEVRYGRQRIPILAAPGDGQLVVEIPRGARDARFRIRTRSGSAESARPFQVQYRTVVEDVQPRAAGPGGTVTLRGRHMDKADRFLIGSVELTVLSRDDGSARCQVPASARSAPIAWVSLGRRGETSWTFEVLAPPTITGFQPTAGPAGAEIIIRGSRIDRATKVTFGKQPLRVVRVNAPYQVVVKLPRNAGGSDYLYLDGPSGRVRSEQRFEIRAAPVILSAAPTTARPGQHVVVRGRWFSDATDILIGKMRARVIKRDLEAGSLIMEVPRDLAAGTYKLSAKSEALITQHDRPFVVLREHRTRSNRAPRAPETRDHRAAQ